MTRKSKRALSRDLEDLTPESDERIVMVYELENGGCVTPSGEPVTESMDVIFVIPYNVWSRWSEIPEVLDNDPKE